jgi:hypothetical protein
VTGVMTMKRLVTTGLLLSVLLVSSAQAGSAKAPPNQVKNTASQIRTLAMDWPRVAYASGGRIYVWNIATGATSVVKGEYSNATHSIDAAQVAIADTRIAWIKRQGFGNTEMGEKLYSASVGGPAHLRKQGYVFAREDSAHASGRWIAGVAGFGKVLVVSTWTSNRGSTSKEKLNLITPAALRPIVTGPRAIVAQAVDGAHIAVLRSIAAWPADEPSTPTTQPTVGVYSTGGKLLREIVDTTPIPPAITCGDCAGGYPSTIYNSVALTGHRLVLLTATNPETGPTPWTYASTLRVYDWTTGDVLRTWALSLRPYALNGAAPLAVYGRFAAVVGRQLHVLDLKTGKEILTAPSSGSAAALDAHGLVYAVPGRHGKLVFVPMARLNQLLG